ncbi:MAG: histidinol-phosphate transaminase [Deltaproteobacteria bacterium]
MDISTLIRQEIRRQEGYHAAAVSCRIKLDANENPFSLSPSLQDALFEAMKKVPLNRYPDPGSPLIRERFAEHYGVNQDMLVVGNGSDELIQILCAALMDSSSMVMTPVPTFVMYRIIALNAGRTVIEAPLEEKTFDMDLDSMLDQITRKAPALIFISYPNSPTGNCFDEKKIETVIGKSPGIVVIDEAYGSFSGKTMLPLLAKYDNLVILKTMSKVGLAAMRIGFLIGQASFISELDKVRLPYNINTLSQVAAGFYIDHYAFFQDQVAEVVRRRHDLCEALKRIKGIHPYPTEANFILFRCDVDSDVIHRKLIESGILIKNLNSSEVLKNCMRVTVGNQQENEAFLLALKNAAGG